MDLLANGEVVATLGLMASCELLPNLGEINVDIHKLMLHLDAQDDRNCEIKLAIADNRLRSGLTDANTFYKSKGNIRIDKFICE